MIPTPTAYAAHERSKRFHAEIARRAALLAPKQTRPRFVTNPSLGVSELPAPRQVYSVDSCWSSMWFYHLVFGPTEQNERRLTISNIQRVAADHFGFTVPELLANRRQPNVVLARQIAIYIAKKLTERSLPDIGRRFGNRDHSTMIHSIRKIAALMQTDAQVAAHVAAIKSKVTA